MKNNEVSDEVRRMFPSLISDESAAVLCDFLAELSLAAESSYFSQVRRTGKKIVRLSILITRGKVIGIDLPQHVMPSESPSEIHWVIF